MKMIRPILKLAAAFLAVFWAGAALAHPHILIDAEVELVFDEAGGLERLRHDWTFDPFFSAWMVQGLDTDGDGIVSPAEMQELADENMIGLSEYRFYTYGVLGSRDIGFVPVGDQAMRHEDGRVTLGYSLAPTAPVTAAGRLELAVNDPEYYVAITFADLSSVTLTGAPAACALDLHPPRPMSPEVEAQLYALGPEVLELPPDLAAAMRGTQGMIVLDCPGAAATAREAADQLAAARPTPFGGPPPEVGLNLPREGFFGWIQARQLEFYRAMGSALTALQTDLNAFWVLGGLSFLYGVFHAAGPGHGKVVIGSYMLANETEARRGIALSFISALMQALVAIGFVLIAAWVLALSSLAMADAAHWIGVMSYALVVALGVWLIARKLLPGAGGHHHHHHDHGHAHGHDHHHDHHHDHEDCHHHVVPPGAARGSWREQIGVVLAVGMRPCSGALVVLVFALSQGLLLAGIVATLLMALGTGLTVATLALIATGSKSLARRLGGADGRLAGHLVWWLELLGAFAVLGFGVVLLVSAL